jgi:hypothetical protein
LRRATQDFILSEVSNAVLLLHRVFYHETHDVKADIGARMQDFYSLFDKDVNNSLSNHLTKNPKKKKQFVKKERVQSKASSQINPAVKPKGKVKKPKRNPQQKLAGKNGEQSSNNAASGVQATAEGLPKASTSVK